MGTLLCNGAAVKIRLPDHHIGGNTVCIRDLIPDEDSVAVRVGHNQDVSIGSDPGRLPHAAESLAQG